MAKAEYRSAIRSRKLINAALADLLLEKPLDKITVTDVVKRAEINRGTFYAHYADIPDVINHLIQQTFAGIREVFSKETISVEDTPSALLNQVNQILTEDLDFYRKIMNSSAAPLMQEQLVTVVLDYLIQNEQSFPFISHDQYILTMRFCAGGLTTLYQDWFAGKLPLTLDELTIRADQMLRGIITAGQAAK